MRNIIIVLLTIMTGCSSFTVERLKTNEILGAGYEHLDGKLFSIFCAGDEFSSYDDVKKSCLKNTAKFVHDNGYAYFFMASRDGNTIKHKSGYISNGIYIPTETTTYSQLYVILFITKDELTQFSNFYRVSDYYIEE